MTHRGKDQPGEMRDMWRNGLEEDSGAKVGEADRVIGGAPPVSKLVVDQSEEFDASRLRL